MSDLRPEWLDMIDRDLKAMIDGSDHMDPCHLARVAIAELRAEVDRLTREVEKLQDVRATIIVNAVRGLGLCHDEAEAMASNRSEKTFYNAITDHITARWGKDAEALHARATAAEADAAAAREQVRKLREVLRPFADALSRFTSPPSLIGLVNDDTGGRLNFLHVDAFKAARAALQGEGER